MGKISEFLLPERIVIVVDVVIENHATKVHPAVVSEANSGPASRQIAYLCNNASRSRIIIVRP